MARPLQECHAPELSAGIDRRVVYVATAAALAFVVLIGAAAILGGGGAGPSSTPSAIAEARTPSPRPATARPTASARRTSPISQPSPRPTTSEPAPTATASPEPTPRTTTNAFGAPTNASDFDLQAQAIDMLFPLRADTRYRYRDNFLNMREGPPQDFNHARIGEEGALLRLHDGIDIYAREGEPVVAPFAGVVIDPAERWPGWDDERYGLTVAVESTEEATAGYTAVMVHLEHGWVDPGQEVARGQVLGVLGETGNAEGVEPQLHFELRAPFLLDWSELGMDRLVDAFNPYPSLVRADTTR